MDYTKLQKQIQIEFPHLAKHGFTPLPSDWDYENILVDGEWVFRFPKNKIAAAALVRENNFLPEIIPTLPVSLPFPSWFPPETNTWDKQFQGSPLQLGEVCNLKDFKSIIGSESRSSFIEQLARFLSALHSFSVPQARMYNIPEKHGKVFWRKFYDSIKTKISAFLDTQGNLKFKNIFTEYLKNVDSREDTLALIHGDLDIDKIMISDCNLTSITNFRYMSLSDPALDFAYFYLIDKKFTVELIQKYESKERDELLRRVWNFFIFIIPIKKILHGIENENANLRDEGLNELKKMLR